MYPTTLAHEDSMRTSLLRTSQLDALPISIKSRRFLHKQSILTAQLSNPSVDTVSLVAFIRPETLRKLLYPRTLVFIKPTVATSYLILGSRYRCLRIGTKPTLPTERRPFPLRRFKIAPLNRPWSFETHSEVPLQAFGRALT